MIVFERLDSNTGIDGKYKITGGALHDGLTGSVASDKLNSDSFVFEVKGEKMYMTITGLISYSTDGSKLTINGDAATFGLDSMNGDCQYTVENDVLTIFEADGNTVACKKIQY